MRTLTTAILILFSSICFAQKDSTKPKQLSDTTVFLSISDLNRYSEPLKDQMSARQYETFVAGLNAVLKEAIAEWNRKNGAKKN
jgi:hypothetical protein